MRILYWSPVFWPQIGGVEIIASRFIPAMQTRGHEFTVMATLGSLDAPAVTCYRGTPVHRLPAWTALANRDLACITAIQERVTAIKRAFAPELIHLNFSVPSLFFHMTTAKVAPAPALISFRGAPPKELGEEDTLVGRAVDGATWITAVSRSVLDAARRAAPRIACRSSVIYNGWPMPSMAPLDLPMDPPRVLCIGRLVPEKGVDLAVAALGRLVRRFPRLELVVAGDGPERAKLERQAAELGLSHLVSFRGWVAPDLIPHLINTATLVVVPSRWEGLPGVAIQAGQMARPVVGTRIWGLPEIVAHGETGLLTEPEDCDGLADAITTLLEHPELATRMGRRARQRVKDLFAWDRYLDAYDALYRSLGQEVGAC